MNNLQILRSTRSALGLRQSSLPTVIARFQSGSSIGDRPWDKSTRAVIYDLPDNASPAEIKSRHLPGLDPHSPQVYEPKADKNAVKGRLSGAHFDLYSENWERNQNKDFRSQMRQWDVQQQVFKTSRLIRHQEYGTFGSNRGNISGRPSPTNSTPLTLHQLSKTDSDAQLHDGQAKTAEQRVLGSAHQAESAHKQ